MPRLGFIIYHYATLCRDWTSLYIILSLYAETGLHYISFCRSMQKQGFIIYHSVVLIRQMDFIIYHSAALCKDWASLYNFLPLNAETGLH